MSVILQFDFQFPHEVLINRDTQALAESITHEPGFVSKIWTQNLKTGEAGGLYRFQTEEHAQKYADMHVERAKKMGAQNIRYKIFTVNEPMTKITFGEKFFP
ncbi:YdhR family protein [Microvirga sp. W0021]|uniref:YdhR family protein n=1 Tax=Hohaiivirga grylli TaxID=3133970 RepID=A0ABV0BKM7_9HYPH